LLRAKKAGFYKVFHRKARNGPKIAPKLPANNLYHPDPKRGTQAKSAKNNVV